VTDIESTLPKNADWAIERIIELFEKKGEDRYGGEDVSQTQHALQSALAAENEGADAELVAAAFLHDVGHLLHNLPDDCADHGVDDKHEDLAFRWLQRYFGPRVTEPIRLHVDAKRYLCATRPAYHASLSEGSMTSLALQGGPFRPEETAAFEKERFYAEAVRLRTWDDIAKIKDLPTPDVHHYREYLVQAARLAEKSTSA
jgi:phosphonate degradation associated HDIG domain protein